MIPAWWACCFGFLLRETGALIFPVSLFLEVGTLIVAELNCSFQILTPCLTVWSQQSAHFDRAAAKGVTFCFIHFFCSVVIDKDFVGKAVLWHFLPANLLTSVVFFSDVRLGLSLKG